MEHFNCSEFYFSKENNFFYHKYKRFVLNEFSQQALKCLMFRHCLKKKKRKQNWIFRHRFWTRAKLDTIRNFSLKKIEFPSFEKSNQNTYFFQRPVLQPLQWIQKGDFLSDCSGSQKGELALGKNLLVAYMPWEGFNFEDAVLINENVVYKYTSLHIEKYDLEPTNQITNKIPGFSLLQLQKLDKNGIIKIGSWVNEGDILIGQVSSLPLQKENSLLTHEKLLYDIIGKTGIKRSSLQEKCLRVPQGTCGRIIRISFKRFFRSKSVAEQKAMSKYQSAKAMEKRNIPKQPKAISKYPKAILPHPKAMSEHPNETSKQKMSCQRKFKVLSLVQKRMSFFCLDEKFKYFKFDDTEFKLCCISHLFPKKRAKAKVRDNRFREVKSLFFKRKKRNQSTKHSKAMQKRCKSDPKTSELVSSKARFKSDVKTSKSDVETSKLVSSKARFKSDIETSQNIPKHPFQQGVRIRDTLEKITIYIAEKREFQIGDKISGRHGNKGIISQILTNSDMPYLANGETLDVVLNPLGVPSRMNVGQIFECLLGFAGHIFRTKFQILCFDEIRGYEASRSFIYSKLFEFCKKTKQKWFFSKKNPGKLHLFDGRNGQIFHQSILVGSTYLMKLIHIVDEKIHARATGPYSLITQQPLRGRAKHGGQRFGEMEVWALQGFGSAYSLQELLTVKSDDLQGRNKILHTLLKNTALYFGTPESFRVVLRELQCLCLDVQLTKAKKKASALKKKNEKTNTTSF